MKIGRLPNLAGTHVIKVHRNITINCNDQKISYFWELWDLTLAYLRKNSECITYLWKLFLGVY